MHAGHDFDEHRLGAQLEAVGVAVVCFWYWFNTNPGQWPRPSPYMYPAQISQVSSVSSASYEPNAAGHFGGYWVRRNFTMGLAESSRPTLLPGAPRRPPLG